MRISPLLCGALVLLSVGPGFSQRADRLLSTDYATARKEFRTTLQRRGPSPQKSDPLPAKLPTGVSEVRFKSGALELKAWLQAQPDAEKHPAIVYCHGGFGFGQEDFVNEAARFGASGFVVLTPMLRGENGQAGDFELFVGEVDDVLAAGRFAAQLPGVDPSRVFVSGHSSGATLAVFAALVSDSPFAASAPIGPAMDVLSLLRPEFQSLFVFDPTDPREMLLRSPVYFGASAKRPIYLFAGDQDVLSRVGGHQFAANAIRAGALCEVRTVNGDHHTCKPAAITAIAELLKNWKPEKPQK
jgi:dipeptidyl aminopeptidase/acylaminoacyl peptidase